MIREVQRYEVCAIIKGKRSVNGTLSELMNPSAIGLYSRKGLIFFN